MDTGQGDNVDVLERIEAIAVQLAYLQEGFKRQLGG